MNGSRKRQSIADNTDKKRQEKKFFFFWSCHAHVKCWFPNPRPLQWKHRFLTTGPPRSPEISLTLKKKSNLIKPLHVTINLNQIQEGKKHDTMGMQSANSMP